MIIVPVGVMYTWRIWVKFPCTTPQQAKQKANRVHALHILLIPYGTGITLETLLLSEAMEWDDGFLWDIITHPCRDFNGGLAGMSNFIRLFYVDVINHSSPILGGGLANLWEKVRWF